MGCGGAPEFCGGIYGGAPVTGELYWGTAGGGGALDEPPMLKSTTTTTTMMRITKNTISPICKGVIVQLL